MNAASSPNEDGWEARQVPRVIRPLGSVNLRDSDYQTAESRIVLPTANQWEVFMGDAGKRVDDLFALTQIVLLVVYHLCLARAISTRPHRHGWLADLLAFLLLRIRVSLPVP